MQFFGEDIKFWAVILGATFVKLLSSPYRSFGRAVATVFAAVFAAFVFTDPVIKWVEINPETYRYAVAALLALTGEGLMKMAIAVVNDPSMAIRLWNEWRTRK